MDDLSLWMSLTQSRPSADQPTAEQLPSVEQLQELAQLPLEDRWPFLGPLLQLAETQPPAEIQAAILTCLAGAMGTTAYQTLVRGLEDAQLWSSALAALRESAILHDPSRIAHAVFHSRVEVRRAAVNGRIPEGARWLMLHLLEDPELRDTIVTQLSEAIPPDDVLLILLTYCQSEILTRRETRMLMDGMFKRGVVSALETHDTRSSDEDELVLAAVANPDFPERSGEFMTTVSDHVFSLFCDPEADDDEDPTTGYSPQREFFDRLEREISSNDREVLTSLYLTAARHGTWNLRAAGICLCFQIDFFSADWIPAEVRRAAIETLYQKRCERTVVHNDVLSVIFQTNPLCRRPNGQLDLYVIGGLMFLSETPYELVRSAFRSTQLIAAFWDAPRESIGLFAVANDSQARADLLAEITGHRRKQQPQVLALLAATVSADSLAFLTTVPTEQVSKVFVELLQLEEAGSKYSSNKLRVLGEILGVKFRQSPAGFLTLWLEREQATSSLLGQEVLTWICRELDADELTEYVKDLSVELLERLVRSIDVTSGIPFSVELRIATLLSKLTKTSLPVSSSDVLQQWASARSFSASEPPVPRTLKPKKVVRLKASEQRDIATSSSLTSAIEVALRSPCSGLCDALAQRHSPVPDADVCAALLGCHDPFTDVDTQFFRYASDESDFPGKLDRAMHTHWDREKKLSLLGHAWLHRWEFHLFEFAQQVMDSGDGLVSAVRWIRVLKHSRLLESIWQALVRLISVWSMREQASIPDWADDTLLSELVESFVTSHGVHPARAWICLAKSRMISDRLESYREQVQHLLPDTQPNVRKALAPWIDSRGLGEVATTQRVQKVELDDERLREIKQTNDIETLSNWCQTNDSGLVAEAALRLIELDEQGQRALAELIIRKPEPALVYLLIETIGFWTSQSALEPVRAAVRAESLEPMTQFLAAMELVESGEETFLDSAIDAIVRPTAAGWFRRADHERILNGGANETELALRTAVSAQPHAYIPAVRHILAHSETIAETHQTLRAFLFCGMQRDRDLRCSAAVWLRNHGDPIGLSIIVSTAVRLKHPSEILTQLSPSAVDMVLVSALAAGDRTVEEDLLCKWILDSELDPVVRNQGLTRLLQELTHDLDRETVLRNIKPTLDRNHKLRHISETFHWGIEIGRDLTGRLFKIEMLAGEQLGYTRMNESRVYINAMPILKREQHGRDVVEGLILHEYGHHMYHRGQEKEAVWDRARDKGMGGLYNMVADEHLERNLRALDRSYGDRLKRLAAYAFQHSSRDTDLSALLRTLGTRALEVLTQARFHVSPYRGMVRIENGAVLLELERCGSSFARFFRALRMGLGNRHNDPKVAQGLALFRKRFRDSSMEQLYDITARLREIFGDECQLCESFGQDSVMSPHGSEVLKSGEGITDGEVQREVRRITNRKELEGGFGGGSGDHSVACINVSDELDFDLISTIVPLTPDRRAHGFYAREVAADARKFRSYLSELGLAQKSERRRVRGRAIDRASLPKALVRSDPRILVARETYVQTDLFMGIVIDCSGSMEYRENIETAKRFATLLVESAAGMSEVDVRVIGFTDQVIYDAGDANRPAVHALEAGGGNNDAAGLWYAAQLAMQSQRNSKLLVMISDGLPTECSVEALRTLVKRLTNRMGICCAQVAVEDLEEVCFPHYVLLKGEDRNKTVTQFGKVVAKLVRSAMKG